jgi:hypothetical protein
MCISDTSGGQRRTVSLYPTLPLKRIETDLDPEFMLGMI